MRLAILRAPHDFAVVDQDIPEIGPDDVLVRVANCGVCASELDLWAGRAGNPFPWYPGHEVSGTVERIGTRVTRVKTGDAVAVWVTQRGYAEYVTVPAEALLPGRRCSSPSRTRGTSCMCGQRGRTGGPGPR